MFFNVYMNEMYLVIFFYLNEHVMYVVYGAYVNMQFMYSTFCNVLKCIVHILRIVMHRM